MLNEKAHTVEVWAKLLLSAEDRRRIRDFFVSECGIRKGYVVRHMHLTVYHARRPLPGLVGVREPASVILSAAETRFMPMTPRGENPRPEIEPARYPIGIRIHRQSTAMPAVQLYRSRLLKYETPAVLGGRKPSTHKRSAFGARAFQPHVSLLYAESGIDPDLKPIGHRFREVIGNLTFDTFRIEIDHNR